MKRLKDRVEWERVVKESGATKFEFDGNKSLLLGRTDNGTLVGWFDNKNSIGVIKERINTAIAMQKRRFDIHEQLMDKQGIIDELRREVEYLQSDVHFAIPKTLADVTSGKIKLRDIERVAMTFTKIAKLMKDLGKLK